MPDERPHTEETGLPPEEGDAPQDRDGKDRKALSDAAADVFATWQDLPPVHPQELSSRIWAHDTGPPEDPSEELSTGPTQSALPTTEPQPSAGQPSGPDGPAAAARATERRSIEDAIGRTVDEAIAGAGRRIVASLGPGLERLAASLEDKMASAVRSHLSEFAAEQGRVLAGVRGSIAALDARVGRLGLAEVRDSIAALEARVEGLGLAEVRDSIAALHSRMEGLRPPADGPEPATAARVEEGFATLSQQVGEIGPQVGEAFRALREAVLAKLAADDQVRDAVRVLSERLASLEDRTVMAVEEPIREVRREVAHDLGAMASRVEAALGQLADGLRTDVEGIRDAVTAAVERVVEGRLSAIREEIAHEVSSEIATVASMARTAVGEARFARGQLAQAVKAMGEVVTAGDQPAQ